MNAPPFPTNPSVGEFFGNWVWNGARWVCSPAAGVRVVTQVFTASGPYMPSSGLVTCVAETLGAGGGGGGTTGPAGWSGGGGGGGSGGYSRATLAAALVAGGVQVTIGVGGQGDIGHDMGTPGAPGTATTFGALCVANGGLGGQTWGVGSSGQGGQGAPGGAGDLAFGGNGGVGATSPLAGTSTNTTMYGGTGGAPPMLGGGVPPPVSLFATGGAMGSSLTVGPGCGGMGGLAMNGWGTADGGNGGPGLCVVTEYCWADTAADDCLNPPVNVNARVAVTHVPWPGPGPCPPGWGGQVTYEGDD